MREGAFHVPFLIWLSAGDLWVLINEARGGGDYQIFLSESTGHVLGLWLWISFRELYRGSVGQPGEEDRILEFPCSKQTPGYLRTKSTFGLEILNSVMTVVLRHTGRLFSWHFSAVSLKSMRGIVERGEAGDFLLDLSWYVRVRALGFYLTLSAVCGATLKVQWYLLHAENLRRWIRRLYFPSEGRRAEDFFALKIPTASVGFEPANLGTKGPHATPRPPKPLMYYMFTKCMKYIQFRFTSWLWKIGSNLPK